MKTLEGMLGMGKFAAVAFLLVGIFNSASAMAGISESQLSNLTGWTILGTKQISGHVKADGTKESTFEGCEHGRVIIFADGTTVTCQSYGYQYAYMPTAVILGKSISHEGQSFTILKMIVNNDIYDVLAL